MLFVTPDLCSWMTDYALKQSEIPEKWRAANLSKVEMPPENMVSLLDLNFITLDV